jgi:hypothetical protein
MSILTAPNARDAKSPELDVTIDLTNRAHPGAKVAFIVEISKLKLNLCIGNAKPLPIKPYNC